MRALEESLYSHQSKDSGDNYKVEEIAASAATIVPSFEELVTQVALISYHNKDHLLFYRGQRDDYMNEKGNSSFYPSIYRVLQGTRLTSSEKVYRFNFLENACRLLIDSFEDNQISSVSELKRRKYIQWSILQHYEVCSTPLLDLTQSIRVACSFALNGSNSEGYFYAFGLPYITNRISRNSEHEIVNIRLINTCPPEALRPYFQEGYLAGTDDVTYDYEEKSDFDFKRRLIAKFKIVNADNKFWKKDHNMRNLLMPKNDPIETLCEEIKGRLEHQSTAERIFEGIWRNDYTLPNGKSGWETVEIVNGNQYLSNGNLKFIIDLLDIDRAELTLRFRKVALGSDKTKTWNRLKVVSNRLFEGIEGKGTRVVYSRIDK